jgi:hypothetical protein
MLVTLLLGVATACRCAAAEVGSGVAGEVVGNELLLEVHPEKTRAYLHEAVPVTVTLLAGSLSLRNIQYPRLDGAAFRTSEFSPPRQTRVARNGREYAAYEFSATLVPRKSGEIELGPAQLRCDVLAPASGAAAFFGGSEPRSVTVRSQPVRFSILPLPTRGRPAGYGGAVGRFTVSRQVSPTVIRRGDPVSVTTRIEGVGNIDSFSCESISLPGVRAYPPRARRTGKRLICAQVLLPETATRVEIPAASLSFFDPLKARYRTLKSQPTTLEVSAVASTAAAMQPARTPPVDKTDRPAVARHSFVAVATASLLLGGLIFLAMRRKNISMEPAAGSHAALPSVVDRLAEAERALEANEAATFHTAVFRALQAHLAARYGLAAQAITGEIVAKVLRPSGMPECLVEIHDKLFVACDRARYAPTGTRYETMQETFRLLQDVTRY